MFTKTTCCLIFLQALSCVSIEGKNILFFHTIATASHRTAIWPLAEKLADLGNNVTYIFPVTGVKRTGSHHNVEEIAPSKMIPILGDFCTTFDINIRLNNTVNDWTQRVFSSSLKLCEAFYESPEIQEWIHRPGLTYDLLMIDASLGECAFGLIQKFKAKYILFAPFVIPFIHDTFGIVPESSSVPEMFFHAKPTEMTFSNRVLSTVSHLLWRYNYVKFIEEIEVVVKDKMNLTTMPSIFEYEANPSLVFINHHIVEEYPISLPPWFVSYSGLWCSKDKLKARKPLPKAMASFIEDSDGFIYISFGSSVIASKMPKSLRDEFFNAFRRFPRTKFLWRWTGEIPGNTPDNLLLHPWFPQNDVLAHPKIKGFVTQAGRPSTQEAICHAVPIINIPFMGDQDYNGNRLEYLGVAIKLDISNITTHNFGKSIQELLINPKYQNKMKEMSAIFRDRPLDPLENALYWVNYVLRHDTSLMKPLGLKQTWYQRRLLDVYAFLLAAVILFTAIITVSIIITVKVLKYVCKVAQHEIHIKQKLN